MFEYAKSLMDSEKEKCFFIWYDPFFLKKLIMDTTSNDSYVFVYYV